METFQVDKNQVLMILTTMASGLRLETDTINSIATKCKKDISYDLITIFNRFE
jgi:hypothetical protein